MIFLNFYDFAKIFRFDKIPIFFVCVFVLFFVFVFLLLFFDQKQALGWSSAIPGLGPMDFFRVYSGLILLIFVVRSSIIKYECNSYRSIELRSVSYSVLLPCRT